MTTVNVIAAHGDGAVRSFILDVTVPLFADVDTDDPKILGTGTLLRHEGRLFIVTASHILKEDQNDLSSADTDFERIAFPLGLTNAQTHTLGSITVVRPAQASNIDVAVIEVLDGEVNEAINEHWRSVGFGQIGSFPSEAIFETPFMVNGYLVEGSSAKDGNIGQKFLALGTRALDYTPLLPDLIPSLDRFLMLNDEGELASGETDQVPSLKGMSGASVWTINKTGELWDPSLALKIVGVQSAARRGKYVRLTDWSAVMALFRSAEIGFETPP